MRQAMAYAFQGTCDSHLRVVAGVEALEHVVGGDRNGRSPDRIHHRSLKLPQSCHGAILRRVELLLQHVEKRVSHGTGPSALGEDTASRQSCSGP